MAARSKEDALLLKDVLMQVPDHRKKRGPSYDLWSR